MFPSRVEVFAHNCCLRTNATLRIRWTFSPKGCKAGNEGIHISSGYELFPKKYIFFLHIHRWYMGVYVYIYICVNPESLGPLKRIDMFLGFFMFEKNMQNLRVVFFPEKKCIYKKLSLRLPGCICNLLLQTSIFTKHLPSRTNLPRSWCF